MSSEKKQKIFVVLHNIRSAHNVGSIFRTADAFGVEKVFLCGVTPAPLDRFGRARKDIAKVALGAEVSVPWEHVAETASCIEKLQHDGVRVVALEQVPGARPLADFVPEEKDAYVFGNEVDGVPADICARSDVVLEISMHGHKESLNVSVVAGIVLFQATRGF